MSKSLHGAPDQLCMPVLQAPSHGGHSGIPGNMKTSGLEQREEGVDAYAAQSHGDHLVHGLHGAGTGYAGATAARGDTTAPTGSLPPGDFIPPLSAIIAEFCTQTKHFFETNPKQES